MAERVLTGDFELEDLCQIETYIRRGGYRAAVKALKEMTPQAILEEMKKANLRGRGGAGFPAGVKWSFVPARTDKPKYLCVNADEGEPGTFKDRFLMIHSPHLLLEGMIIASYCVGIHEAYIYIRGEYETIAQRLEQAVAEAMAKGYLGPNLAGTEFCLNVCVHRGAGAYICGEETALLESLEGKRGHPRLKPPFPASVGLFQSPTVINNVETVCNIPFIIQHGAGAGTAPRRRDAYLRRERLGQAAGLLRIAGGHSSAGDNLPACRRDERGQEVESGHTGRNVGSRAAGG
jgi:NADH-quinone oxidoreductase subunit F